MSTSHLLAALTLAMAAPDAATAERCQLADAVRPVASVAATTEIARDSGSAPGAPWRCPRWLSIGPFETRIPASGNGGACAQNPVDGCVYQAHTPRQARQCLRRVSRQMLDGLELRPALACRASAQETVDDSTTPLSGPEAIRESGRPRPFYCGHRFPAGPPLRDPCPCRILGVAPVPGEAGEAAEADGLLTDFRFWMEARVEAHAPEGSLLPVRALLTLEKVTFHYRAREILGGGLGGRSLGPEIELFRDESAADLVVELPLNVVSSRAHCADHEIETSIPRAPTYLDLEELHELARSTLWAPMAAAARRLRPPVVRLEGKRYALVGVAQVNLFPQAVYKMRVEAKCVPRRDWTGTDFDVRAVPRDGRSRLVIGKP